MSKIEGRHYPSTLPQLTYLVHPLLGQTGTYFPLPNISVLRR